ncbi:hypothetical protein WICPIJ_005089, partial [Wickerhamomyces pijperi]
TAMLRLTGEAVDPEASIRAGVVDSEAAEGGVEIGASNFGDTIFGYTWKLITSSLALTYAYKSTRDVALNTTADEIDLQSKEVCPCFNKVTSGWVYFSSRAISMLVEFSGNFWPEDSITLVLVSDLIVK